MSIMKIKQICWYINSSLLFITSMLRYQCKNEYKWGNGNKTRSATPKGLDR